MGQENAEIVRRMYEAFHGGDAEGALACFDPGVEIDATARVDGGAPAGSSSRCATRWSTRSTAT